MLTVLIIIAILLLIGAIILFAQVIVCPRTYTAWITWIIGTLLFIIAATFGVLPRILIIIAAILLVVSFVVLIVAQCGIWFGRGGCKRDKCDTKKRSHHRRSNHGKSSKKCGKGWDCFDYGSYDCSNKSKSCASSYGSSTIADSSVSDCSSDADSRHASSSSHCDSSDNDSAASCDSNASNHSSAASSSCDSNSGRSDYSSSCGSGHSSSDKSNDSCNSIPHHRRKRNCDSKKCDKFAKKCLDKVRSVTCKDEHGNCIFKIEVFNCKTGKYETVAIIDKKPPTGQGLSRN